jgi:hypothetical protein
MDIVNVNERHAELVIGDTGDIVQHGQTIEVPDELGEALLQQEGEWAKPTTKVAKQAKKAAKPDPTESQEIEPSPAEDAEPESKEHA